MTFYDSYAGSVWSGWNQTTAYSTSISTIWTDWTASSTTLASTQQVWVSWQSGRTHDYQTTRAPQIQLRAPTEGELRIARGREANFAREQRLRRAAWEAATAKSVELLRMLLDAKQMKSFDTHGYFDVIVGERVYRLGQGQPKLIKGTDNRRFSFCIHPREPFPKGDELASLKLMLESNEKMFLSTANASRLADAA